MPSTKEPLARRILRNSGEVLITGGVVLILYVVWQLFVNDPIVAVQQEKQAQQYTVSTEEKVLGKQTLLNPGGKLKEGQVFGKVYIPKFGNDWVRLLGQGTYQRITLNTIGVGHYLNTAWPGQVGNFAVAAHRTTHGAPFNKIDTLTTGDKVFIETNKYWFTYEFRQSKVVLPTDVNVIKSVPKELLGAKKGGRYMTMTSCHPKFSAKQRYVVWLELVASAPTANGMPADLVALQNQQ